MLDRFLDRVHAFIQEEFAIMFYISVRILFFFWASNSGLGYHFQLIGIEYLVQQLTIPAHKVTPSMAALLPKIVLSEKVLIMAICFWHDDLDPIDSLGVIVARMLPELLQLLLKSF